MGDSGILIGLVGYFIFLATFNAMYNGVDFSWNPPGDGVTKLNTANETVALEQTWYSNALECTVSVALNFNPIGLVINLFQQENPFSEVGGQCRRDTVSTFYRPVDSFFNGLTDIVGSVIGAFNFMAAALVAFWDLILGDLPGPAVLNVFFVWVPAAALAFLIYRQIRGVGG